MRKVQIILLFLSAIFLLYGVIFSYGGLFSSKNDLDKVRPQLEAMGYSNIEYDGYAFFQCSDEDTFKTAWVAKDKDGNEVKGCVCSSYFKGATIRFK